jgi:hypothetical protein
MFIIFCSDTAINDLTLQIPEELGTPFTSGSFGKVYRCSIETAEGKVEVCLTNASLSNVYLILIRSQ